MLKRSLLLVVFLFVALVASTDANACSSCHGGVGGGGGFFLGGGRLAAARSNLLAFRSRRAAAFGFFGRSNRLQIRANLAARRAVRRSFF